jgi:hypothetical protein
MSEEIKVTPVGGDTDPRDAFAGVEEHYDYQPWKRPLTYVTFALGINAVSMLAGCFSAAAIVLGWFAFGLGIAAVLVGNKEIARMPQAEHHPFIKWGKRTGFLGLIIGPIAAIIWIILIAAVGIRF